MNNNKFESNKKYFTISIYTIIVVTICALIIKTIFSWERTAQLLHMFFNALSPFLIGFLIAYILNPIVNLLDEKLCKQFLHISRPGIRIGISLFLSYLFAIGLFGIVVAFLIPQIVRNITDLASRVPDWINEITLFLLNLKVYFPNVDMNALAESAEKYMLNLLDIKAMTAWITSIVPQILIGTFSFVKAISTTLIAIIVSCYMLYDKKTLSRALHRFLYALLPKKRADSMIDTAKDCHRIFSGFISGKTLDSIIIGILCFIFMTVLKLPYTLLISLIVGVTNMIPYFGPFIGAVPGAFIILLIDPLQMVIYLILILVLQQFDGLYLGPKILGDSTGLRPIWIIFAITIGGAVGGFIGMFLGVPCVAVIAFLTGRWVDNRLEKKQIFDSASQPIKENPQKDIKSS